MISTCRKLISGKNLGPGIAGLMLNTPTFCYSTVGGA
jgi:hypothetical protein